MQATTAATTTATNTQDQWLNRVAIASPCTESWEGMAGDERMRACAKCEMNVYNLSGMGREEAEAFVRQAAGTDGRVCIRFFRRADGTVLTKDCPVGLAAVRKRMALIAGSVVALLVGVVGWAAAAWSGSSGGWGRDYDPNGGWSDNLPKPIQKVFKPFDDPGEKVMMGEICIVPAPTKAPAKQPLVPIEIDPAAHE